MQVPAAVLPFSIASDWADQGAVEVLTVLRSFKVILDALRRLRMNRQTPLLPPLRVTLSESYPRFMWKSPTFKPAISARRNPTCNPTDKIARSRRPNNFSGFGASKILRLRLRKRQRHPLPTIDGRPLHITYRVLFHYAELHEVCKETRERGKTPAHRGRLFPLFFAHQSFPRHDGAVIDLAQFIW
jgi:hypothetical protein